jgi:hypothetical protein
MHGDNAAKCTTCGETFRPREPVFVAGQSKEAPRGHAVCPACKPVTAAWGDEPHWRHFACEHCGRTVHYLYDRQYRYCTYHCASIVWTRGATERRSRYRAEHRIKHLACQVCGIAFTASRSGTRYCSATCRKRARRAMHRRQGQP